MKVVILAGGFGTRLAEETATIPKPMVEVGGRPLLWHLMKHYSTFGRNEFIVALGYKGEVIKRYFLDWTRLQSDLTVHLGTGQTTVHDGERENWTVHLVDTGLETMTGGRVGRLRRWIGGERFMLTYGDGVSSVDIDALEAFHARTGKLATVTAVRPPARFGEVVIADNQRVAGFREKSQIGEGWINGGFMVIEPQVLDYVKHDRTVLESDVLEQLAQEGQLAAYCHDGFWQCMDTVRDRKLLESLWAGGSAPWRLWN